MAGHPPDRGLIGGDDGLAEPRLDGVDDLYGAQRRAGEKQPLRLRRVGGFGGGDDAGGVDARDVAVVGEAEA
jgi:hypothetical protein